MPNRSKGGCALGVTFDFPIHRPHVAPAFNEGEWVAVPPIMDMLKAAKPFFHKSPSSPGEQFLRNIHLVEGRIYGCTGETLVEFKVGEADLPAITLSPEEIAVLAAFKQEITHISLNEERVVFLFASCEKYEAAIIAPPSSRFRQKLDKDWLLGNDLFDATACRKQFIEQFSALPGDSYVEVRPDGFVGYASETDGYKIILHADTRANETLIFDAAELLLVMKIADQIDFTGGDATFTHPGGRGFAASKTIWVRE